MSASMSHCFKKYNSSNSDDFLDLPQNIAGTSMFHLRSQF